MRREAEESGLALPEVVALWSDPGRVPLHEMAHHWHGGCAPAGKVEEFLRIRYRSLAQRWSGDPATLYADALRRRQGHSPEELDRFRNDLDRRLETLGVPRRYREDFHALENDGAEYFAIAIEMLVHQPDRFCAAYRAEEIAWLASNLGSCLRQLPRRAPCFDERLPATVPAASTTGNLVRLLDRLRTGPSTDCINQPRP